MFNTKSNELREGYLVSRLQVPEWKEENMCLLGKTKKKQTIKNKISISKCNKYLKHINIKYLQWIYFFVSKVQTLFIYMTG